jgi:hypothetical protein
LFGATHEVTGGDPDAAVGAAAAAFAVGILARTTGPIIWTFAHRDLFALSLPGSVYIPTGSSMWRPAIARLSCSSWRRPFATPGSAAWSERSTSLLDWRRAGACSSRLRSLEAWASCSGDTSEEVPNSPIFCQALKKRVSLQAHEHRSDDRLKAFQPPFYSRSVRAQHLVPRDEILTPDPAIGCPKFVGELKANGVIF